MELSLTTASFQESFEKQEPRGITMFRVSDLPGLSTDILPNYG